MTEPIEPTSEAEQIAQLQQQIRQAEVDCAYWRGRCEEAEKLTGTPTVTAATPATAAPPPPAFSPDKLLALLPSLLPLLSNPDVLKLLLPLLKNLSAPRPPADG